MAIDLKHALHQHCFDYVSKKIEAAQEGIGLLQASANEDTKSSAGDKYETSREMIQGEINKYLTQLGELNKQKKFLEQLQPKPCKVSSPGALVVTDQGQFFIAISAGIFKSEAESIMCISQSSPLGTQLSGKKEGDSISLNGKSYKILAVS